jgi:hypothetical protein
MPARRNTYRNALPAAQRGQFDRLVELLDKAPRTLRDCHVAGTLIKAIKDATGGYGTAWAPKLSRGVTEAGERVSPSLVYRLFKLVEVFSPGDIDRYDGRLTWESAMRLLAVEDAGEREAVLRAVLAMEERPPSRRVQALIRERCAYRKPRGGAARPGPSSHPNDALRALRGLTAKWPGVYTAWIAGKHPASARAGRLKADKLTEGFLSELKQTAVALKEMAAGAGRLADDLTRLEQTLRKRAEAGGPGNTRTAGGPTAPRGT